MALTDIPTRLIRDAAVTLAKLGALTTKGDVLTHNGSDHKRLGVGSDGQVLMADSTEPNGVTWDDAGGGPQLAQQGVLAPHTNLSVGNVTGSLATQMQVTADELIVTDDQDERVKLSSVDETVDITTSGAGGLDTGSEAAGTWYHIWIIHDADAPATAAVLSTSAAAPTLPSGYTYMAYVGAVYNESSGDLRETYQTNHTVAQNITNVVSGVDTGGATQTVDISAALPTTASLIIAMIRVQNDDGSAALVALRVGVKGNFNTGHQSSDMTLDGGRRQQAAAQWMAPDDQVLSYQTQTGGTNASGWIWVCGWQF